MRQINPIFQASNTLVKDNFHQQRSMVENVVNALHDSDSVYKDYFLSNGRFLLHMMDHYDAINDEDYYGQDFQTLLANNHRLYEDITEPGYQRSFVNPTFAVQAHGLDMGRFLSAVAYMFRTYVGLVYEGRLYDMAEHNDLYLLMYDLLVDQGEEDIKVLSTAVRDHLLRHIDITQKNERIRRLSATFDTYSHIVDNYDLTDLRYLFRYGMYIGDNEIKQAKYILSLPEDKKQLIADTYTEAYFRGFERNGISLENKTSVHVIYSLGFEDIMKKAYKNFAKRNLKPFAYYFLRGEQRPRLYNTRPNLQMAYDHRFSNGIFMDDIYVDRMLESYEKTTALFEEEAKAFSGLALFEVYGEESFEPKNMEANMVHDSAMAAAQARLNRSVGEINNKYIPGDSFSFTINDYPLPSIGDQYEEIFQATIDVNTLEEPLYEAVQAKIIDALDMAEYVHVTGRNGNETDIRVSLHPLSNPAKETKFDNCTADVNVPVGEVYTSPVLEGTNGLLHVKEVYLTDLRYVDLKIWFEDGMISKYTCKNFDTEEENRNFVRETLMHPHDTLPLGEFAIGTNTVAYMMAKKYGINDILPILIGEKTGPHFAIGDTCFRYAEDSPVYNTNGKEMVARDNEVSILRKKDPEKAYTFKHTDITIPYNELDTIAGYNDAGESYTIIQGGRFVLPGTELLNRPFDEE